MNLKQFQLSCIVIPNFPFKPHYGLFIYVENKYNKENNMIVYEKANNISQFPYYRIIYLPFEDRNAHFYVSDDDYFGDVLPNSENFYAFLNEAYPLESDEFTKIIYSASDQRLLVNVGQNVPESICGFVFFTGFRFGDDPIFYYIPWDAPCFQNSILFRQLLRSLNKVWVSVDTGSISSKLSRDFCGRLLTYSMQEMTAKGYSEYLKFAEGKINKRRICGTLGFSNDFKTLYIKDINDKELPDSVEVNLSEPEQSALYCFFILQTKSVLLENFCTIGKSYPHDGTDQQKEIHSIYQHICGNFYAPKIYVLSYANISKNITTINHKIEDKLLRPLMQKPVLITIERILVGISKTHNKTLDDSITPKELKLIIDQTKKFITSKKQENKESQREKYVDYAYRIAIKYIDDRKTNLNANMIQEITFNDLLVGIEKQLSEDTKQCSADNNSEEQFKCSSFLILKNELNKKGREYAMFLAFRRMGYMKYIKVAEDAINGLIGKSKKKANSCSQNPSN